MHTVTFTEEVSLHGKIFQPEQEYLMESVNAGEYLTSFSREAQLKAIDLNSMGFAFDPDDDWNDSTVLVVRPGGFGDLLFCTPIFRELRSRWPGIILQVACSDRVSPVLHGNPHIDELVTYPVPSHVWGTADAIVTLENAIEWGPLAKTHHAVDVFADCFGLKPGICSRKMDIYLDDSELALAEKILPNGKKRPVVGIQLYASSPVRSYARLIEVIADVHARGGEVVIFAAPGQPPVKCSTGKIINLHTLKPAPTFRQACAVLRACDVVVAPDSSITHAAAALDVPCVALYGSFPWKLRVTPGPRMVALSGNLPCAPCLHHSRRGQMMPENCPGAEAHRCVALDMIDPKRVTAKVWKLMEENTPTEVAA